MQNKKSVQKISRVCLIIPMMFIFFNATGAVAGAPTEQLKGTLNRIIKALNDPGLKGPEKISERRDVLLNLISERFDEDVLSEKVLGKKYWSKRTEKEKKEFVKLFSNLLFRSYFDKIDSYLAESENFSPDSIKYLKETQKGKYAVVVTKLVVGADNEVMVYYRLINKNNDWFVCDLAIEGVSIVKNYRAQFKDILINSSFQDLLEKLKEKDVARSDKLADKKKSK
jgi:phospholipid transport system substrate-binding protein